ncbi:MAG: YHS domain-containing protein [Phycisphaerae bacterium]|nr:YHS domain-containing protein [Phycisphaerae bacterium]
MLKNAAPDNPELAELVAKMLAEAEKNRTVQTVCPVMGSPIDKEIFVDYQGKRVFFCCPACKDKFNADPQKYLEKLPQFKK